MINDWVNKGHTNLNMFSVVDKQIRSLSSKQSKLNFWNQLHPKIALLCRFWTQTATWRPNHTILTSSVIAILKAMIDTVFLGPSSGGVRIFYERWEFFTTRESTLGPTGWSLSYVYTSEPWMHNSEPWKYAIIKRVCYSAIPCAEHCEQPILLTDAGEEYLEIQMLRRSI